MMMQIVAAVALIAMFATPAEAKRHRQIVRHQHEAAAVVPHPIGCPGRSFCGCGVSVKVFGSPVRDLYLASNWFKFPRAAAGPGMVAVRNHHVFYIMEMRDGHTAVAYDPNSGGHQTRIHLRSLAGYTVVNPGGGASTMLAHNQPRQERGHRIKKRHQAPATQFASYSPPDRHSSQ